MNSKKPARNFVVNLFIFFVIFLALSFSLYIFFESSFKQTNVTIGLKWVNQAQFAGMYTAKETGEYSRNGLNVSFKEFDINTNLIDDLLTNKTDFVVVSAEEFLHAVDNGAPIKAIGAIYQISPYAVVSLSESGMNSPADFNGRVLGNKGGKVEENIIYKLLLSTVGLSENDVTIKDINFDTTEFEDLKSGSVEGVGIYRTDQLYFFDKENVKYNLILPERYGINVFNDIIVTKNSLIESNPDLVNNFMKSTVFGWEFVISNQDKAIDFTLKYVTSLSYKDRDYETYILQKSIPLIKPDLSTKIGSMTVAQWNNLYSQLDLKGFMEKQIDINTVFTNEFLP